MKKVKLGKWLLLSMAMLLNLKIGHLKGEIIRIQNLTKTSTEINYYSGTIDKNTLLKLVISLFRGRVH